VGVDATWAMIECGRHLHWGSDYATAGVSFYICIMQAFALAGALASDHWLGKLRTQWASNGIWALGTVVMLAAVVPSDDASLGSALVLLVSMVGVTLVAFGSGAMSPSLSAFVGGTSCSTVPVHCDAVVPPRHGDACVCVLLVSLRTIVGVLCHCMLPWSVPRFVVFLCETFGVCLFVFLCFFFLSSSLPSPVSLLPVPFRSSLSASLAWDAATDQATSLADVSAFYSWYYFFMNVGSLLGEGGCPLLREHVSFFATFASVAISMVLGLSVFWWGKNTFVRRDEGIPSPHRLTCQCVGCCMWGECEWIGSYFVLCGTPVNVCPGTGAPLLCLTTPRRTNWGCGGCSRSLLRCLRTGVRPLVCFALLCFVAGALFCFVLFCFVRGGGWQFFVVVTSACANMIVFVGGDWDAACQSLVCRLLCCLTRVACA